MADLNKICERMRIEAELKMVKAHLEFLRCSIAKSAGALGLGESIRTLLSEMDESTRRIAERDVESLEKSTNSDDANKKAERKMVASVLRTMAIKIETLEELEGFEIRWTTGGNVDVNEEFHPSLPMTFVSTTVVLGNDKEPST